MLAPRPELLCVVRLRTLSWNDGYGNLRYGSSSECDLRGEARAQSTIARIRQSSQTSSTELFPLKTVSR